MIWRFRWVTGWWGWFNVRTICTPNILLKLFFQSKNASKNAIHLPITVKLIFKFRVGELRKSTRHLYIPSSESFMLSTFSWAGWFAVLKNALNPNTVGDDQSFAWPNWRPLTSKLQRAIEIEKFRLIKTENILVCY